MSSLSDILPLIAAMTYNDLKDFIDYSEFYLFSKMFKDKADKEAFQKQARNRRAGIPTGALPYLVAPDNPLVMTTAK